MSSLVQLPPDAYSPTAFKRFTVKSEFDIANALALMWMSQLAYETEMEKTIAQVTALWSFDSITPFFEQAIGSQIFDTRGIIAEGHGVVILAFAGTDPGVWQNLATDARFLPSPNDTHRGFQHAIDGVDAKVREAIDRSRALARPLFVTGHSLGGALAALAAEQAFNSGVEPAAVYAYGMPRTGGATFRDRYNPKLGSKTYRLVHGVDLVARVPMSAVGYRHVGRVLLCDHGAKFDPNAPLSGIDSDAPAFDRGIVDGLGVLAQNSARRQDLVSGRSGTVRAVIPLSAAPDPRSSPGQLLERPDAVAAKFSTRQRNRISGGQ